MSILKIIETQGLVQTLGRKGWSALQVGRGKRRGDLLGALGASADFFFFFWAVKAKFLMEDDPNQ